jgi:type IV secretion system protein VirB11
MHNRLDLAAQLALRTREMMIRHLGSAVLRAFANPDVTEIYVNPDGRLRLERRSRGSSVEPEVLEAEQVYRFLNTVDSSLGLALDETHPQIQAELPQEPFGGARLQGFVPPLVAAPCFVVRKLSDVVYSLDDYVLEEVLLAEHRDLLRTAVDQRWNVLVAGGTGSGKTTFANALLLEIAERFPSDRIVVLEDTVELQSSAADTLALRTTPEPSLADPVQ